MVVATAVTARAVGFHWWLLLARCDGFALGSILATLFAGSRRVVETRPDYGRRFGLGLAVALAFQLITVPFSLPIDFDASMSLWPSLTILGFNLVYFNVIGLVLCHAGHPSLRVLRDPRLCYLGTVSYGLYIYHPLVFHSVGRLGASLGVGEVWWMDLAKVAASIGLASASWHLVERPILSLRDRLPYGSTLHNAYEKTPGIA